MEYIQADSRHLIDKKTFKFMQFSQRVAPYSIDVPFYLWNFQEHDAHAEITGFAAINGRLQNVVSHHKKVFNIQLNNLQVTFLTGYAIQRIQFLNPKTSQISTIDIKCQPELITSIARGRTVTAYDGMDYDVAIDGKEQIIKDRYDFSMRQAKPFVKILYHRHNEAHNLGTFCYGIRHLPYEVVYNEHKLSGACYAYLLGSYCILLGDDLSFDSIAILKGVNAETETLYVKGFIYTVNPYITKMMMLAR